MIPLSNRLIHKVSATLEPQYPSAFRYVIIRVEDDGISPLISVFDTLSRQLENWLSRDLNVLVHWYFLPKDESDLSQL